MKEHKMLAGAILVALIIGGFYLINKQIAPAAVAAPATPNTNTGTSGNPSNQTAPQNPVMQPLTGNFEPLNPASSVIGHAIPVAANPNS